MGAGCAFEIEVGGGAGWLRGGGDKNGGALEVAAAGGDAALCDVVALSTGVPGSLEGTGGELALALSAAGVAAAGVVADAVVAARL